MPPFLFPKDIFTQTGSKNIPILGKCRRFVPQDPLVIAIIVLARTLRPRRRNIIPPSSLKTTIAAKKRSTRDVFSTFNPRRLFTCEDETRYSNYLVTLYRIAYKGWATINRPRRTPASIIQGLRSYGAWRAYISVLS